MPTCSFISRAERADDDDDPTIEGIVIVVVGAKPVTLMLETREAIRKEKKTFMMTSL